MICSTCEGRGDLGSKRHWTDCVPGCDRDHAKTCVSCMGSGFVGNHRITSPRKVAVMDITSGRAPELRVFNEGEPYNLDPPGPHPQRVSTRAVGPTGAKTLQEGTAVKEVPAKFAEFKNNGTGYVLSRVPVVRDPIYTMTAMRSADHFRALADTKGDT